MMKKVLSVWLLFSVTLITYAQNFTVNHFEAEVFLDKEGFFTVNENYAINFHSIKHGIFRNIQLTYHLFNEEGKYEKRKIKVSDIKVPGYKFETSSKLRKEIEGELEIKIGDKNKTVSGLQNYTINYRVDHAYLYESNAVQFYWNLKPSAWIAPFQKMSFTIHVPEGISVTLEDLKVYTGALGNTEESSDFIVNYSNGIYTLESKAGFVSNYSDSVTVLLSLPPGSIKEQVPWWPFGAKYGWTLIIGLLYIIFFLVWRKHGKDDKVIAVTSYYPPKEIDPALAGFLIDDSGDTKDLMALIPYWGAKGFITIEELDSKSWFAKDDIKLTRLKNIPGDSPTYQRQIFNGLFKSNTVLVSSLKDSFYVTMQSAKASLKKAAQPYYLARSRRVMYITAAVLIACIFVLIPITLFVWGLIAAICTLLACIVLLVFNVFMIKKNKKGNEVLSQLKGFKQFVKLSELKKLEMLVAEDTNYFEDTMAYAMAFGLFDKWASKFDELKVPPPNWYRSHSNSSFTMHHFSNSFSSAMSSAQSTMVSSPSSSSSSGGGGSSGGGFGGGGGGSW